MKSNDKEKPTMEKRVFQLENGEEFELEYPSNYNEIVDRKLDKIQSEYDETVQAEIKKEDSVVENEDNKQVNGVSDNMDNRRNDEDNKGERIEKCQSDDIKKEGEEDDDEKSNEGNNEKNQYQQLNDCNGDDDDDYIDVPENDDINKKNDNDNNNSNDNKIIFNQEITTNISQNNEEIKSENTIQSSSLPNIHNITNTTNSLPIEPINNPSSNNNHQLNDIEFINTSLAPITVTKEFSHRKYSPIKNPEKVKEAMRSLNIKAPKWAENLSNEDFIKKAKAYLLSHK